MFIRGEIPKQARLRFRIVDVKDESSTPVPVVIVLVQESNAWMVAPLYALIALLRPRDLNRGRAKRGLLKNDLVASRNIHFPIPAIERLCPDKRCRICGTPGEGARTDRNALNGNAVGKRERGYGMHLY